MSLKVQSILIPMSNLLEIFFLRSTVVKLCKNCDTILFQELPRAGLACPSIVIPD